jgi:type IV secretion system protein VirB4
MTLGDLTVTIVLAHQDRETLTSQKREVQRILHTHGCTSIDEELNAVDAYMGTLPGLPEANVRQYPVSSWNAIHVSPWSRPWLGQDATTHLHAPPLVIATTHRHLPYGFSPFVDDVANMLMAGPVGSGKTAALGQFALYWLARYTPARLFMFDVKRGARCLVHCLGGHYYQIGRDRVAFQPLAGIDESTERTWACGWIIDRLRDAGIQINGVIQGFVEGAMEMLARMPQSHRTVTGLLEAMDTQSRRLEANSGGAPLHIRQGYLQQHRACREALRPFTAGHTYGYLLDASYDGLMEGDIQCFELQSLLNTPHLVAAVQSYIWHRLYALFQAGIPTLFVMDECGISMKHPRIREDIDQGLRLLRDKLVGFAMATQDVLDFVDRDIGPMLLNNCPTRLLLPNPSATDSTIRTAYEALGLPEHAIKRIAISTPKRQIFVQQRPLGETLIDLPMAPLMRCIAGSSSPEDHARMDEILAKYGPEEFPQQWLIQHGFPKEANTLETMSTHSTMDDDRWRAPRLQRMLAVG